MRALSTTILLSMILGLGVAMRVGSKSPAAQRKNAEARLVQAEAARERARGEAEALRLKAEAEADGERQRAQAQAEASLAATRQIERDAAHQRAMESLIGLSLVMLPLSLVAGLVALLLSRRQDSPDSVLLVYLDRLQRIQAARERELWHALATIQRRALPADNYRKGRVMTGTIEGPTKREGA